MNSFSGKKVWISNLLIEISLGNLFISTYNTVFLKGENGKE